MQPFDLCLCVWAGPQTPPSPGSQAPSYLLSCTFYSPLMSSKASEGALVCPSVKRRCGRGPTFSPSQGPMSPADPSNPDSAAPAQVPGSAPAAAVSPTPDLCSLYLSLLL